MGIALVSLFRFLCRTAPRQDVRSHNVLELMGKVSGSLGTSMNTSLVEAESQEVLEYGLYEIIGN